ncbi:MAG: glycerophosphodiester phosphodiesterase, partial [Bulleidia sp.]|nr:glycerophosphodiester phosphodiesterase [Bulleidia sp.]
YIESKKMNYQYVETDVQLTSDEVPVLLHNPTLSHMAGINVAIDSITEEEAKQFDLRGQTITSLEEFIAYCKANLITPYIELKTETIHSEDQVKMIFDIVEKYEMVGKVEWISFSSDLLRMVAQYDQTDMLGFLAGSKSDVSDIQSNVKAMKEDGCNVFLDVHYAAQMSYLDFCKENDIPLELWGINSIDVMNALDGYITGVTTDTIRN